MSDTTELLKQAGVARALGNRRLEEALYRNVLRRDPDAAMAQMGLGALLLGRGDAAEALTHLRRALDLAPNTPWAWLMAMDAHIALRDGAGAKTLVEEAMRLGLPRQLIVDMTTKARTQNRSGQAKLGPVSPEDFQTLLRMNAEGAYSQVIQAAETLLRKHGASAPLLALLGAAQAATGRLDDALGNLRRSIETDPGYAEGYLQLGQFLLRRGRLDEAIEALQRAWILMPLSPSSAESLGEALLRKGLARAAVFYLRRAHEGDSNAMESGVLLATALAETGDFEEADPLTETLMAAHPDTADVLFIRARVLSELGREDEALSLLDRCIAMQRVPVNALAASVTILQKLGRFDEARATIDRIFALDSLNGRAFLNYVRAGKVAANDPVVARFERADQAGVIPEPHRIDVAFALAKSREDQGDYEAAFGQLKRGNDALKSQFPPLRLGPLWDKRPMIERAAATPAEPPAAQDGPTPIFVSGLPRSGTTLAESILASHPDVAAGGELNAASELLGDMLDIAAAEDRTITTELLQDMGDAMEGRLLPHSEGKPFVTDKGVLNFAYIGLIARALPKARIVIVDRDPRDTCLSIYRNRFQNDTHRFASDLEEIGHTYLRYRDLIDHWAKTCPDAFHVVRYEDLVSDPEATTRSLLSACGLTWDERCLEPHKHRARVKTLSTHQVRQPVYSSSVGFWDHYRAQLAPLLQVLDRGEVLD